MLRNLFATHKTLHEERARSANRDNLRGHFHVVWQDLIERKHDCAAERFRFDHGIDSGLLECVCHLDERSKPIASEQEARLLAPARLALLLVLVLPWTLLPAARWRF